MTTNPHSQIFAVAIQLGLIGTVLLFAMWIAHLALFRGGTLVAWFGLIVVVQNVVSSLFNSHLSDFAQGWLYPRGWCPGRNGAAAPLGPPNREGEP